MEWRLCALWTEPACKLNPLLFQPPCHLTSLQHFNTSDGGYLGKHTTPPECVSLPSSSARGSMAVRHNRLAAPHVPQLGPAHLQTWQASIPGWDQHHGWKYGQDCTHWCQPGMPELWLPLLNKLLAERRLGNAVNVLPTAELV